MNILKRCPFCRGQAHVFKQYIGQMDVYHVECESCFAKSGMFKGIHLAQKAWNKRTFKKQQHFKPGYITIKAENEGFVVNIWPDKGNNPDVSVRALYEDLDNTSERE